MIKTGLGQDSHRFVAAGQDKPLMLGGIHIEGCAGLDGNSDADVVLHALTNAVSGVSTVPILGAVSDRLCLEQGITDSRRYLAEALGTLGVYRLVHVSVSIEALRPKLAAHIVPMRASLAELCGIELDAVAITATTGEGLTGFGRGEGIQALVIVTALRTPEHSGKLQ
jgi:2-C-methyl-D-erythritol 2,4-cyclodiphosphate synthase